MNIFADQNIPFAVEAFSHLGDVTLFDGRLVSNDDLTQADILLVRSVTKVNEQLLKNTNVRFVASATIGTDHIDFDYLTGQGISFANAPASNAVSAAEYTLCAFLFYCKELNLKPANLRVGIVGHGNVGSRVRQRLRAMGVETVVYDPPRARLIADVDYSDWNVIQQCDVVTAHVPLTKNGDYPTYRMFNESFFKTLKERSLFINTARGQAVDEQALLKVLEHKNLSLILDVWQNEPAINDVLVENTLLSTAHIAGYSFDGKVRGTEMIYQAVCNHFSVEPEWCSNDVLNDSEANELEFNSSFPHALFALLNQAYSIQRDSEHLRETMALEKELRGEAFDKLRKFYPKRREFSYFDVVAENAPADELRVIQKLGFNLVTELAV